MSELYLNLNILYLQTLSGQLLKRLITIPGECYPEENLSLIHTPVSVEPCCGTHVLNTKDIQVRKEIYVTPLPVFPV